MEHPRDLPDEVLMERYQRGDEAAFEELFHRYEEGAYGFFLRRTACEQRAKDLYQELFLRIHRARESYDAARPFAAWMFQIARRLLVDDYRRAFRSHEVSIGDRQFASAERGPEERIEEDALAGSVLAALSDEERRVLIGAKAEGRKYAEIAEELGKSVDAVKKIASRAMQRLRSSALQDSPLVGRG